MYRIIKKRILGDSKTKLFQCLVSLIQINYPGVKVATLSEALKIAKEKGILANHKLCGSRPLGVYIELQKQTVLKSNRKWFQFWKPKTVKVWECIGSEVSICRNGDRFSTEYGEFLAIEKLLTEKASQNTNQREGLTYLNERYKELKEKTKPYYLVIDKTKNLMEKESSENQSWDKSKKVYYVLPYGRTLIFNG